MLSVLHGGSVIMTSNAKTMKECIAPLQTNPAADISYQRETYNGNTKEGGVSISVIYGCGVTDRAGKEHNKHLTTQPLNLTTFC